MIRALRAYPAMLRAGMAESTIYRAEFVIWILTTTMPLIMLALWDALARGGPVAGFGRDEFAAYFTVNMVARQLTASWVVWELNGDIRYGRLSPDLLKPVSPIWLHSARNLAAMPLRFLVLVPIVGALLWWRPTMGLELAPGRLALFLWSCAVAWAIGFAVQVTFGALAFWLDQSVGLFELWFGVWSLLGGYLLPMQLLPDGVREAAYWLPFRAMLAVPIEIGTGRLPPDRLWLDLGLQLAWLAVAAGVMGAVWRLGLRRYGAFGA